MPNDSMPGASGFVRTRYTWLVYALTAYFSYIINALGPMMPFLRADLNMSYTLASVHFTAFAGGRVVFGILADALINRYGRQKVAIAGAAGGAAGMLLLVVGLHPAVTVAGSAVIGLLGSAMPVITQSVLADEHGRLRGLAFVECNALASASATVAPLFLSAFARTALGWRPSMVMAVVAAAPLLAAFRRYPLDGMPSYQESRQRRSGKLVPAYWAYWVSMMLAVSVEFSIIFWSADFAEKARGLARADAALSTSVFLGGMLVGRVAGTWLMRRGQSFALLMGSLGLAALGFLVHWLGHATPLVIGGLVPAGLGVANLYPVGLTLAMGAAAGQTDLASARSSLAGGLAMLSLPPLLGRLADFVGIESAYGLVIALLAVSILVPPVARTLEKAQARKTSPAGQPRP